MTDMAKLLEDICEGPARGKLTASLADFINILELRIGGELYEGGIDGCLIVDRTVTTTGLELILDEESGELVLTLHPDDVSPKDGETQSLSTKDTALGDLAPLREVPTFAVSGDRDGSCRMVYSPNSRPCCRDRCARSMMAPYGSRVTPYRPSCKTNGRCWQT